MLDSVSKTGSSPGVANRCAPSPPVGALNRYLARLGMVVATTLFDELGFSYSGPIDGHDLDTLIPVLPNLKKLKGPQLLHVVPSLAAAHGLNATVTNMRFVKPLNVELIRQLAQTHDTLVTVEEGALMGAAGSAVAEALAAAGIVKPILHLGVPDQFVDHGDTAQLLALCGLDAGGIAASITKRFGKDEPRLVANS